MVDLRSADYGAAISPYDVYQKAQDNALTRESMKMENAIRQMQMVSAMQQQVKARQMEQADNALNAISVMPVPPEMDTPDKVISYRQNMLRQRQEFQSLPPAVQSKTLASVEPSYMAEQKTRLGIENIQSEIKKRGREKDAGFYRDEGGMEHPAFTTEQAAEYKAKGWEYVGPKPTKDTKFTPTQLVDPSTGKMILATSQGQMEELAQKGYVKAGEWKPEKPVSSESREQLVRGALKETLKREPTQTEILNEIDRRDRAKEAAKKEEPPFSAQEKARGRALAEGKMDPKMIGALGRGRTRTIDAALEQYPGLDLNKLEANIKAMTDISAIRSIRNVAAVKPRLDDLEKMFEAENNGNFQLANRIKNKIGEWLGSAKMTQTVYSRDTIAQEMMLALSQSAQGSDLRVALDRAGLDPNAQSPAQFAAAVKVARGALGTREEANYLLPYTWEQVRGEEPKGGSPTTTTKTATKRWNPQTMKLEEIK